jgi:hypothetical protein
MKEVKQFRGRNASLWQSAVDQVLAKRTAGTPVVARKNSRPRSVHFAHILRRNLAGVICLYLVT